MVLAVRAALIVLVTWGDMEDNTQASILQLLRQQQQANEGLQIKDIKQAILIAGFIADTNFIGFVDERLPKTDKSDKTDKLELSHGQVLGSLLVVLFAGRFRSLLGVQSKLSKLAIHGLLGLSPEIRIEDISREVCSSTLDALWEYGCDKLFEEYGAAVHKQYNLGECTKAHLDSANYTAYHSETPADLAETPEEVAEIAAQDPDDVEILERASRSTSKSKNKRLFLSSSFFKSEHRIETILWLVHVSLIASTVMETLMQRAASAGELHMPNTSHRSILKKPTCKRAIDYLDDFGPSVRINSSGVGKVANITDVTVELCQCLGEAWLLLLLEQRYTVPQNLVPNLSLTRGQTKITC